ncbi:MAG: peptidylprolyl isomerase [Deltaproteobacteria bacterium]|nr:peptidylprolyl isomerase [Deltaproteobacteria bacterium]
MSKLPIVTFTMENGGVFKAELYPDQAPNTVNNFISLINKGYYNGVIFHRVIPGFMIQGGCPQGTGTGGPGYSIRAEFLKDPKDKKSFMPHKRGVLSMARTMNPDSAGSQFFVMVAHSPHLDGQYASFGLVTEGLEVVDAIVAQPADYRDRPEKDQRMAKVTVETFGQTYPEPEKV